MSWARTIRSLWPQPLISCCKPISFLGPNSWNPLYRPLMAWHPAIDSLETNHWCIGPHPLSSFYRPIEFLRTQPVVSRPPLVLSWTSSIGSLGCSHGSPGLQRFLSWIKILRCLGTSHLVPAPRTAGGPPPTLPLQFTVTPTGHDTGCRPIIPIHPAIAWRKRAHIPLSFALRPRGCACRAVAWRGGEAPGLRIVYAGRAGRLGMQVGRMYRGPRGW